MIYLNPNQTRFLKANKSFKSFYFRIIIDKNKKEPKKIVVQNNILLKNSSNYINIIINYTLLAQFL